MVVILGVTGYLLYEIGVCGYLNRTFEYALFFAIGMLLCRYYGILKKYFRLFPAMLILSISFAMECPILDFDLPYVVTGLFGFFGIYTLAILIDHEKNIVHEILNFLGTNSYGIYLLSYFAQIPLRIILYSKLNAPYWVCVGSMFVGGILIPIIALKFLRRYRILRNIALGEK